MDCWGLKHNLLYVQHDQITWSALRGRGFGYKVWSSTHPHKGRKIYGKAQAEEATESKGATLLN